MLPCQRDKVLLEKSILQRQDGDFLGPTSLSLVTLAKNKFETVVHLNLFMGEELKSYDPPQVPSEKFENKKMHLHEDKSVNCTAEKGCGRIHHPQELDQGWLWNPWW